ncbi:hypothetical protein CIC12_08305 [Burkholderia sp. SG-MS1]|uniref:hypothetical protein n=1 Tax=Paraburkholderia sp. SG-MS1 TaxID=2023741 RepID=UPI001444FDEE|nr:hypothetical protein [Paraburkholderia sp. SG-MS1]NKJ46744.1 hypothetical protein [Paraburkholderia sp. SG-MS1]
MRARRAVALFVSSESFDGAIAGVGLTPLMQWLARAQPTLAANEARAVDAFRLASGAARGHQQGNAP